MGYRYYSKLWYRHNPGYEPTYSLIHALQRLPLHVCLPSLRPQTRQAGGHEAAPIHQAVLPVITNFTDFEFKPIRAAGCGPTCKVNTVY